MTWVSAAIAGGTALYGAIEGNQNRQAARGAAGNANRLAQQNYDARAPFRTAAIGMLDQPGQNWLSLYNPSNYNYTAPSFGSAQDQPAQAAVDTAFQGVQNIDRLGTVKSALASFDAQSAPILAAQERQAAQKAAGVGGLDSGMLNTSLGNIVLARATARDAAETGLINDATNAGVSDKFNQLAAAQNNQNSIQARDTANYNRANQAQLTAQGLRQQGLDTQLQLGQMNTSDQNALIQRIMELSGGGFSNDPAQTALNVNGQNLQYMGLENQTNAQNAQGLGSIINWLRQNGYGGNSPNGGYMPNMTGDPSGVANAYNI